MRKRRPPKPIGVTSNLRVKMPKKKDSPLDALAALSRRTPSHTYAQAFREEINQEKNDRGAAILVVTNLENALQACLESRLLDDYKFFEKLFGFNSPL
jgi:hypothetical protein